LKAKRLDATKEQLQSSGEQHIAAAESHARAAQILAEMLGMVCHREYYRYGNQMVLTFPTEEDLITQNRLSSFKLQI
jgi:hypothetical protein